MNLKPVAVEFITKPDCHLCEEAREVLNNALGKLSAQGISISFNETNMLNDPTLIAKYAEDIPVVLIDGRRHSFWHVDEARFCKQVLKRARRIF